MPHHTIVKILDDNDVQVWPPEGDTPKGERVVSRQAAFIMTDILAGNTISSVNPFWAKWRVTDGVTGSKTRPAAYKTGTTSDNRDVHAYGYLAMPSSKTEPALVTGVWMGNSDNSPNDGKLSLDTSAPLWSAILSDVSKGLKIEGFARTKPKGLVKATVDAFTGLAPSGATRKTVEELFLPGTAPTTSASFSRAVDIDAASGLLWREGCVGPMETRSFIDYSKAEAGFKAWQKADAAWQARAARGPGVRGGPKGTQDGLLLRLRRRHQLVSLRPQLGGSFAPTKKCPIGPPPPSLCVPTLASPCPSPARALAGGGERRRRQARQDAQALTPEPAGYSRTIVAPSPPSPRSPARKLFTSGWDPACARTASRSAPVPRPWMIVTCSRPASDASSR